MKLIKKYFNSFFTIATFVFLNSYTFICAQAVPLDKTVSTETVKNLDQKTLSQLVIDFIILLNDYVLKLLLALIIFVFLYGLMKYMFKGQGSDTARTEGRKLMFWGIVGIFVVTSWMALVSIFSSSIGHTSIVIPQFK